MENEIQIRSIKRRCSLYAARTVKADSQGIKILQGSIQPDHVYMLLLCPTNLSPSEIMQNLKGKNKGYYKRSSHN
ncbi:MAG: transposase [Bacteroides cellulosilyticus]|uniref:Transposase IS200-like domain-containing protein n=1 Tax=Enterocloster bolteae (strain ATCC BAA-613 / DSM 15670 / CCUG 46953 / JCM 12243 / WAL 16351) TaxID=411902 RepID=A8RN82_ENTBW|nr:hypothetical protein CLOBOL_02129 [Enterocloster bolteae ATCC BAA-613]